MLIWKSLENKDISDFAAIALQMHPQLHERNEVLGEKLALFPQGCKKLLLNSVMVGYGLAHPWHNSSIPSLDSFLVKLPDNPDCLYLHDIAILPKAQGLGGATLYVAELIKLAKRYNLSKIALVSVYGASGFWERHGFTVTNSSDAGMKLQSYGKTARYMQYCMD